MRKYRLKQIVSCILLLSIMIISFGCGQKSNFKEVKGEANHSFTDNITKEDKNDIGQDNTADNVDDNATDNNAVSDSDSDPFDTSDSDPFDTSDSDPFDTSGNSSDTDSNLPESQYNYVFIGDIVRACQDIINQDYFDYYSNHLYFDNVECYYENKNHELIEHENECVHFFKTAPLDIYILDSRSDGYKIFDTRIAPYSKDPDALMNATEVLPADAWQSNYGDEFIITKEYLSTLSAGIYSIYIWRFGDDITSVHPVNIVIHDENEEAVSNTYPYISNSHAYYSGERKNDVIFYLNGTGARIKNISINESAITKNCYDLINDGRAVVFHPEFLEKYAEEYIYITLHITTDCNTKAECKIMFTDNLK